MVLCNFLDENSKVGKEYRPTPSRSFPYSSDCAVIFSNYLDKKLLLWATCRLHHYDDILINLIGMSYNL